MKGDDSSDLCPETPINIKKRRRRKSSKPSPSLSNLEVQKRQRTASETESVSCLSEFSDSEAIDIKMGDHETQLPKVSLSEHDIVKIAEAVKQMLKNDIEQTVERVVNEKQKHLVKKIKDLTTKKCRAGIKIER